MYNYYEILGLHYGASISDVKASFRQLAKMYHPDLNPEGIEHFTKVLRAYETLSDPTLKQAYDYKLNYHQAQSQQPPQRNAKTSKTWSFSEKELKRRQYYDEHIRKYAKQTSNNKPAEVTSHYNEFRYILYATPLAVALFVIVMALSNRSNPSFAHSPVKTSFVSSSTPPQGFTRGDNVYAAHFASGGETSPASNRLHVTNKTGKETILCIFTDQYFVKSYYLAANDSAIIDQLPNMSHLRYVSGAAFDPSAGYQTIGVKGLFTKDTAFFKTKKALRLDRAGLLELKANNPLFEKTNARDFFTQALRK